MLFTGIVYIEYNQSKKKLKFLKMFMYFDDFLLSPRELALLRYCHSYTASSYMDTQDKVGGCNGLNCFAVKLW